MKFGEVLRRPETRRAPADGLCESLKAFGRGERVSGCGGGAVAGPLRPPERREAGCPGGGRPAKGAQAAAERRGPCPGCRWW